MNDINRQAYPLFWPQHWTRSKHRTGSQFKTSLTKAMENVEGSVRRFSTDSGKKIDGLLISSNFSLADRKPKDPGVACFFTWDGIETCICVDRYDKLEDNLQAIHHCIEAERTKLRHGGLNLVRASFRGYAALPPPKGNERPWWVVFDIEQGASVPMVTAKYKQLRSKEHPDKGGDARGFDEVNRAWREYQEAAG